MLPQFISRNKIVLPLTMRQWLILSICFSCLLVCVRTIATGYPTYLFLVWNLFLGWIPYMVSQWLSKNAILNGSRMKLVLAACTWLLFIPNSFYILTDLFHLEQFDQAPKWFDLLLIFSFAWNGLLLGMLSIRRVEMIVVARLNTGFSRLFIGVVMFLNAFGIYIGRYLRYNSWDVLLQPFSLCREMLQILLHPLHNKMEWGMITVYTIFLILLYATLKKLGEDFYAS